MSFADIVLMLFMRWSELRPAPRVHMATGIATTFYAQERWNNGVLACKGEATRLFGHHLHLDDLPIVATRYKPRCGSVVEVKNLRTGKVALALRLEAGPWGCRWPDGSRSVVKQCFGLGGRRIVDFDLSRSLAQAIGSDGRDPVRIRWEGNGRRVLDVSDAARITGSRAWCDAVKLPREGCEDGPSLEIGGIARHPSFACEVNRPFVRPLNLP